MWQWPSIENILKDVRYALRMLRKNPGFTAVAVLTLALGIGANTAIFSVIDAVLFSPLPVQAPHELIDVYGFEPDEPLDGAPLSYPDYRDFRDQTRSLTGLVALTPPQLVALDREGESRLDPAQLVSTNYFDVLGVKPFLGHMFESTLYDTPGDDPYAVLSYATWEQEFGSDRQIIGKTIRLNGALLTIIGVAPPGFEGLWRGISIGVWVPLTMDSVIHLNNPVNDRGTYWLLTVGRLKPGVSLQQAQAEFSTIAARLAVAYPKTNKGRSAEVLPANQVAIMPAVR